MQAQSFFATKLGKASLASVTAMVAMIALTSQLNLVSEASAHAHPQNTAMLVELA
ncbi:hypothetical protein [Qipengyuania nanhaisediminis]|uniref:hypothetical protein n=1 Tax=Qipengyuania nanhaisediminis TaxID=604088 RepID=UPI0038B3B6F7